MKSIKLLGLALGASLAISSAALADDLTVAVAGPMTGEYSAFGRQLKNGAEMAIADLNASGGVLGKKLALDIEDDACDPKQARSVAKRSAAPTFPLSPVIIARHRRFRPPRPTPTTTCCRS